MWHDRSTAVAGTALCVRSRISTFSPIGRNYPEPVYVDISIGASRGASELGSANGGGRTRDAGDLAAAGDLPTPTGRGTGPAAGTGHRSRLAPVIRCSANVCQVSVRSSSARR